MHFHPSLIFVRIVTCKLTYYAVVIITTVKMGSTSWFLESLL